MKTIVKGFGINRLGVEWGYEFSDDGNRSIYVADNNDRIYVGSEEEAVKMCWDLISTWDNER